MKKIKKITGIYDKIEGQLYTVTKNELKRLREQNKKFETIARTPKGCIISFEEVVI